MIDVNTLLAESLKGGVKRTASWSVLLRLMLFFSSIGRKQNG